MISQLFVSRPADEQSTPVATPEQPRLASESASKSGIVLSFSSESRYGFIRPDEPGDNLFFHITSVADDATPDDLKPGTEVRYYPVKTDRGMVAAEVSPLQALAKQ